jgi:DNA-binding response OmpR family regulator/tetratricopeptide (TPR) repeat protein/predicted Ser/Thr protein kinase
MLLMNKEAMSGRFASDLRALGYAVEVVNNKSEALDRAKSIRPSVVVLEDQATGMNPVATITRLREKLDWHVPVVLVSNFRLRDSAMDDMRVQLGLGHVVCKPFSLSDLDQRLRRFCNPQQPAVINYIRTSEVFYSLLGLALRSTHPMSVVRDSDQGAMHIFLREGKLVAVTSSDPRQRDLGELLVAEGLVSSEEVVKARQNLIYSSQDLKLGAALRKSVELPKEDLDRCLRRQAELRLLDVFGWRDGEAQLQPGETPPRWAAQVHLDAPPLVFEAIRERGDPEMLKALHERFAPSSLEISRPLLVRMQKLTRVSAEKAFLERLAMRETVSAAQEQSRISPSAVGAWLAFLIHIVDVDMQEAALASGGVASTKLKRFIRSYGGAKKRTTGSFVSALKLITDGDLKRAAEQLSKVSKADPTFSKARALLSWCQLKQETGDGRPGPDEVLASLRQELEKDPQFELGHVLAGRIHRDAGEPQQALDAFLRALEINPGSSEAMKELRTMHQVQVENPQTQAPAAGGIKHEPPTRRESTPGFQVVPSLPDRGGPTGPFLHDRTLGGRPGPGPGRAAPALRHGSGNPFCLVMAQWNALDPRSGQSKLPPLLDSRQKAKIVQRVSAVGALLEEFGSDRLVVLFTTRDDGGEDRKQRMQIDAQKKKLKAALLALKLMEGLRDVAEANKRTWIKGRAVVVEGVMTHGGTVKAVQQATRTGSNLITAAGDWSVVAGASVYKGLEDMVITRTVPQRPEVMTIARCNFDRIRSYARSLDLEQNTARATGGSGPSEEPVRLPQESFPPEMDPEVAAWIAAEKVDGISQSAQKVGSGTESLDGPPLGGTSQESEEPTTVSVGRPVPATNRHARGSSVREGLGHAPSGARGEVDALLREYARSVDVSAEGDQETTVSFRRPGTPSVSASSGAKSAAVMGRGYLLKPGSMLGNYKVKGLVGSGGMGNVYLATDVNLGRNVAIKLMRPEVLSIPAARQRFKKEAKSLAKINSLHVTQIYALSLESRYPYLVMEYVNGASLYQLIQDRGVLPLAEAVDITIQAGTGLQAVLSKGMIHRDINPKNLLINKEGVLKITDFGLVKTELVGHSMSATNSIVGTPIYMSPEQAQGKKVDFYSDMYALGVTAYHMIAGRPPFEGATVAEVLIQHIMKPVPPIRKFCPDIPGELATVLERMLAKAKKDRPESYDELLATLRAIHERLEQQDKDRAD